MFDSEAAQELAELIKSKEERRAIFNALDKLRQLGPSLVPPHVKTLKNSPGFVELRPRQGRSASRLVYRRCGDLYVILALSKDHASDLGAAIGEAQVRFNPNPPRRCRGGCDRAVGGVAELVWPGRWAASGR